MTDAGPSQRAARSHFTTRPLPAADQFDAWREFNADIIDLLPADGPIASFGVDHRSWNMGGIVLERTQLPGTVERLWRHRTRSYIDHWCVVMARGTGEALISAPSNLSIRSLTQPFEGRGQDEEIIVLYVPRDRFAKNPPSADQDPTIRLSPGCQSILAAHLDSLVHQIDSTPKEAWPPLAEATCALVAACLLQTPDQMAEAERPIFSALRERARRIVNANMASPDFGPDTLARLLFVSRSKLYRLFEPHGGVARFIQHERLAEAHRRLTDETAPNSINDLSADVGFRDHSAFSRAFRTEFGCSPREARDQARAVRLVSTEVQPCDGAWTARHDEAPRTRCTIRGANWRDRS
ncbi:hypothetical protein DLJ53_11365 [Acuticoccus sediminis]|uniref:HTH araC/xylS-type domain-containing protein n=1 Tax=Acuticoccus sediminis TaxID=2184697 RepID=A0A8B2NTZ8_9HYPH|nr:helix-turn-helix domain-containing protein [Acuticoccus sediminis]RAI01979.1 hypothetical protein DLJ53_11365 [Acuticoccus sediminis]